jgi:hypothetical protein
MERWRQARGQATSEYVALVALVAVVLALAGGLTSGGVAGQVLAGLQAGLCQVAGAACDRPAPADADLAPCPLERTTRRESLDGAFELVRLGGGGTLTTERDSDGRVTVTLASDVSAGAAVGIGSKLSLGGSYGAEATVRLASSDTLGRSWDLPDAATARAFVARYGSKATLAGKAVDAARSGCSILCDAIGWRPHAELPPPDEVTIGRGAAGSLVGSLGAASVGTSAGTMLGAQLRRDGSSTWFMQLDAAAGAELGLGAGTLGAGSQRQTVVGFTLDARRRPTQLALRTLATTGAAGGVGAAAGRTTAALRGERAQAFELDGTLDLHDARNRAAAEAFVRALRHPRALAALQRAAAALSERIERTGVVDRRVYELSGSAFELGAAVALGARLGGAFAHTREGMRLLSAETRLPGLPFLPRDDCRAR